MPDIELKYQSLAEFLVGKRRKLGLSQQSVATELGITPQMVSKWENGKCAPPSVMLEQLSEILQIRKEEFLFNILASSEAFYRSSLGIRNNKSVLKKA